MVKIYFQRKYVELYTKRKLLTWENRKNWLLGYLTLSTQQNYVLENSSQFRVIGVYLVDRPPPMQTRNPSLSAENKHWAYRALLLWIFWQKQIFVWHLQYLFFTHFFQKNKYLMKKIKIKYWKKSEYYIKKSSSYGCKTFDKITFYKNIFFYSSLDFFCGGWGSSIPKLSSSHSGKSRAMVWLPWRVPSRRVS